MPQLLTEQEQLEQMAEMLIVQKLDLTPEVFTSTSTMLLCLRWLKKYCADESVEIRHVNSVSLISRLTGTEVTEADLAEARQEIEARRCARVSPVNPSIRTTNRS
jgi:hypothetical protein